MIFLSRQRDNIMDFFSSVLSWLSGVDGDILVAVNSHHTPFLDSFMWAVSDRWIWLPLYLMLALMVYSKSSITRCFICILMIAVMIFITDQLCASIIRPFVCRMRPSNPDNPLSLVLHLVNGYHGGRYGFPSCHAANTFALAVFLSLYFKNRWLTIFIISWSLLVSYSRMYLGVHYPGDIIGGFAIGTITAVLCYAGMVMILKMLQKHEITRSR